MEKKILEENKDKMLDLVITGLVGCRSIAFLVIDWGMLLFALYLNGCYLLLIVFPRALPLMVRLLRKITRVLKGV